MKNEGLFENELAKVDHEEAKKEEVPESPEKEEADGEVELGKDRFVELQWSTRSDSRCIDGVIEGDMDHLDQSNIITTGRRTRGKKIDFKAILEQEGDEDEEDEEDDGDVAPAADDAEEEEEEAADDEE